MKLIHSKLFQQGLSVLLVLVGFIVNQFTIYAVQSFGTLTIYPTLFAIITLVCAFSGLYLNQKANPPHQTNYRVWQSAVALLGYFSALIIGSMILYYFGLDHQTQANQQALQEIVNSGTIIVTWFTIVVSTPILEELIFREFLPRAIESPKLKWNKYNWLGYGLTIILFTILHAPNGLNGILSYGLLAVTFTIMRIRYHSVYASIGTHVLWNTIVFAIMVTMIK